MATKTTIELECPGCGELLELDAGFSGGVCRCFKCGTLMTVPADPAHERAERLSRPARPETPGRPAVAPKVPPAQPAPSPVRPPSAAPPSPAAAPSPARKPPARRLAPAAPHPVEPPSPSPPPPEEGTFVTASGKVVRLQPGHIPTARKRQMVKYTTTIVFFGILGLIVLGCAIAFVAFLHSMNPGSAEEPVTSGYDPNVNLLLPSTAGLLGHRWGSANAVVVDLAGKNPEGWWPIVSPRLTASVVQAAAGARFQFAIVTSSTPRLIPAKPGPLDPAAQKELVQALNSARPPVAPNVVAGLDAALGSGMKRVVLISGRTFDEAQMAAIQQLWAKHSGVRLDVLLIDQESPALESLAKQQGGWYLCLPLRQLIIWNQQAQ